MAYLYIPDNQMNGWSAGQAMPDRLTQLRQGQYQQQMTQPAQQNSGGILWVQGEEGAKGYLVAAGNSVMLMDSENSTFYIKSTDASGMPLPLRIFDYTERTMAPKTHSAASQAPGVEYVTWQEFDALAARMEALAAKETAKPKKTVKEDTGNE